MRTVNVGGEEYRIEDWSGRKGTWALRLVQEILKGVPGVERQLAEFVADYEQRNAIVLDRAMARVRYGDALAGMSEEDWEHAGHKLRLPRSPSMPERVAAAFPTALDLAEESVVRLLALVVTSNAEVKRLGRSGGLKDHLDSLGADLLDDGMADELAELAVAAAEVVDEQFRRKADGLGERLQSFLRLMGIQRTVTEAPSTSESSNSNVSSSTASPEPTGGTSPEPSTEPVGVSSAA